mgnify:CR=1 FL=1
MNNKYLGETIVDVVDTPFKDYKEKIGLCILLEDMAKLMENIIKLGFWIKLLELFVGHH